MLCPPHSTYPDPTPALALTSLFYSHIRANVALLAPLAKMESQGRWGFQDPLELPGLRARKVTR